MQQPQQHLNSRLKKLEVINGLTNQNTFTQKLLCADREWKHTQLTNVSNQFIQVFRMHPNSTGTLASVLPHAIDEAISFVETNIMLVCEALDTIVTSALKKHTAVALVIQILELLFPSEKNLQELVGPFIDKMVSIKFPKLRNIILPPPPTSQIVAPTQIVSSPTKNNNSKKKIFKNM